MASSDEEGELLPNTVTNYHILNTNNVPITFSDLPYIATSSVIGGDTSSAFIIGKTDDGLQSVHKQVVGWKYDVSYAVPEVYLLYKDSKSWIKLLKPRKSYEVVVKCDLIVARLLHFVKRCGESGRDEIMSHLVKSFSCYDVIEPIESFLTDYVAVIRSAVDSDKDLAKSKYLQKFLMEIDNPGGIETLHEDNQTTKQANFIVYDDEEENDDEDDEDEVLFDSVCAFCDNGGHVLLCEGQCIRSFHPTIDAGEETCCESLGFENAAQYEAIPNFLCDNCKFQKHQCFACGMLGSSDKSSAAEVFPCVSATCGHFYHPECAAKLLHPSDETLAEKVRSQIATGESFTCPAHKCYCCEQGEDKDVHELQFAVCRRCPKAYHRKCLPKTIAFEDSADGTISQRAWDGLLPKRILIYCLKHKVIPSIATPRRDHLLFPSIERKRNEDGSRTEIMSERRSKAYGNYEVNDSGKMPKVVERPYSTVINGDTVLEKEKSSSVHKKGPFFEANKSNFRNHVQLSNIRIKLPYQDTQPEQRFISKPVKKTVLTTPPRIDADMETRILRLKKDSTSSYDFEEFIREKKRRCTHEIYAPQTGLDKTISMGKVEASVKAVKAALRILEDGGSIEDAKAVCEPNVLSQLSRWKNKLQVFLAPFLIGTRYTSFGRHFTKVDKLKEIVDRLHWYVEDGDVIVDFCCGSNDFSCFMKEKLDSMGKKCLFKNYDLITPKNAFNFEKKDWFSVPVGALPDGSRLVMGLNPPFGVRASLANKFIDHALKFKPKLLILIVPQETKRLDQKRTPYDLIWKEEHMLSGKSFYLPGSMGVRDQPLDDWNVKAPPLSLWSRPDWTTKHKAIARKHSHRGQKQETVVSNYLMEEKHDCYNDFSSIIPRDITTIFDDVPELPDGRSIGENTNMTSSDSGTHFPETHDDLSPLISSTNSQTESRKVKSLCVKPNPSLISPRYTKTRTRIPETGDDIADTDLSSPVMYSTNSRSAPRIVNHPWVQPNRYEHHRGFSPPGYTDTSVPYGPDTGGYGYSYSGQNHFPTHHGSTSHYADFTMAHMHPQYGNDDYPPYPTNIYGPPGPPVYGQPEFTNEPNMWPPGTAPPDRRYY